MATTKRQRQKEGRAARLEAAMAEQRKAKTRRRMFTMVGLVAALLAVGFLISVLTDDDDATDVATSDSTSTTVGDTSSTTAPADPADPAEPAALTAPEPGASITGETPCPEADGSSERTTAFESPPPMCIDEAKSYTATVTTSKGEFTIELLDDQAPLTVNNFVVLARYHYFEGIPFHRIIPGFVVQGGDIEASGSGGPGYDFEDELPDEGAYEIGSVAMANSGPDTNGSQFFIVTGDQGAGLPPSYSLFGQVTEGMDVVMEIEAVGSDAGTPSEAVTIESVEITES